jgi:hypothetical protein
MTTSGGMCDTELRTAVTTTLMYSRREDGVMEGCGKRNRGRRVEP